MASKKTKAKATSAKADKTRATRPGKRASPRNTGSSAGIVVRDNRPAQQTSPSTTRDDEADRIPILERFGNMGATHVATVAGAGVISNALGVLMVGKGWVGPKITSGITIGTGVATTAAGWYWESDHIMAAGAGVTASGVFSLSNQLAVDAYEAMERRAQEKKADRDRQANDKRLADARALIEAEDGKRRNGRRIVITNEPESAAA